MGQMKTVPAPGLMECVKIFFSKYADFSSRSRRAEYWKILVFNMLVCFVIGSLCGLIDLGTVGTVILGLYGVATLVPGLAIAVRRLHDTGHSGWFYLLLFVPIVNLWPIILILFIDSKPEANKWGESTKYVAEVA